MSRTTKENVYCQAAFTQEVWNVAVKVMDMTFTQEVWNVAVKVMDMYEEGNLKQQKLSQRHLLATPEFKQHYFLPLHHLKPPFQEDTLQLVANRQLSLSEMKEACNKHRAMTGIKRSFMRCTNTQSWDEAVSRFGAFADEGRLAQFTCLNFHKQIPEPFRDYCQSALNSENPTAVDCYTVAKEGTSGYVLQADTTSLTAARIKQAISCYMGANLIITHIPQVMLAKSHF